MFLETAVAALSLNVVTFFTMRVDGSLSDNTTIKFSSFVVTQESERIDLGFGPIISQINSKTAERLGILSILRKEVIQPHLPIRLPCYDLVPLTPHTLDGSLLTVEPPALGADNSGDLTGGVYKARERIHRRLADRRLLAIPASCRRVAAYNPN